MCRIYYAKRVSKLPVQLDDITTEKILADLNTGSRVNSDGSGIYQDGKVSKVIDGQVEMNEKYLQAVKNLAQGGEVYLHQRLATQGGNSKDNTQPIETNDFVVIHNGQFYQSGSSYANYQWTGAKYYGPYRMDGKQAKSDTLEFTEALQTLSDNEGGEVDLAELVDETLWEFSGQYSMFVIDKRTGEAVYTKSANTSFEFYYLPKNGLVLGATSEALINCFDDSIGLFVKEQEHYRFEPGAGVIYTLDSIVGCF